MPMFRPLRYAVNAEFAPAVRLPVTVVLSLPPLSFSPKLIVPRAADVPTFKAMFWNTSVAVELCVLSP